MTLTTIQINKALKRILYSFKWYTPEAIVRASKTSKAVSESSAILLRSIEPSLSGYQRFKLKIVQLGGTPLLLALMYGDMAVLTSISSLFSDFFGGRFEYYLTALRSIKHFAIDANGKPNQIEIIPLSLLYGILIDKNRSEYDNTKEDSDDQFTQILRVISTF